MNRGDVTELHFITPMANVASILEHGILSHKLAARLPHSSVAMHEVQERRKNKQIPGARTLHEYANLYFDAHNPMLCCRRNQNDKICVLKVDSNVLDLPEVIVTDRNAASKWVRFYTATEGLKAIDRDVLFARYWTHPNDQFQEWDHKSTKCAEVLVPDSVKPVHILGAYVAGESALAAFRGLNVDLPVTAKMDMFF